MIKAKETSLNIQNSSVDSPSDVAQVTGTQKFLFDTSFDTDTSEIVEEMIVEILDTNPEPEPQNG